MRNFLHKIFHYLLEKEKKQGTARSIRFGNEKKVMIIRRLSEIMEQQKPYLDEAYNLKALAGELKLHQYQLSAFLNHELGMNFNDYVNRHRVRYCEELIRKGDADKLNLKGLASKSGFHNRNTFTTAFKKFTGHTPSAYSKRYIKSNSYAE